MNDVLNIGTLLLICVNGLKFHTLVSKKKIMNILNILK